MLADSICAFSLTASPIGIIPKDFDGLDDLCRIASIGYRDTRSAENIYRHWFIVPDEKPSVDSSGRQKGSAVTSFVKFCMLLDFIEYQHPDWTRDSILRAAKDQRDAMYAKLMKMSWKEMNDEMAKKGVPNYNVLRIKKVRKDIELPQFD
jgi:hypothetical protein